MTRRDAMKTLAATAAATASAQQAGGLKIRHVDIMHHTHTDFGYTDMPSVCRDLQVRYLDAALQTCLDDKRFHWTLEGTVALDDWWRGATEARRNDLVRMIRAGQMDVMAAGFNQTPFQNALQWKQSLEWLPEDVWRQVKPQAAMQNDVNGMPRAGAMGLLDRGVTRLIMGINPDSGGPPFARPVPFWWKMPDGRRMFVWLGDHYGTAYGYFEEKFWIAGQPKAGDPTFGPPREGDMLRTDEESLRKCHAHLLERLKKLEDGGYKHERLILSYTNQWRWDNDVPFPPLPAFVEAWNKLGLSPTLRFTTATQATADMEHAVGASIPTYQGEWTDWWANGDASCPRELAASRAAKRNIAAALATVWGEPSAQVKRRVSQMLKDVCLFDEHTFGANISVSEPESLFTLSQFAEKSLTAYRPMGHSEWLLGQRARARLAKEPAGIYVVNTAREPYSGWVTFQAAAVRDGTKIPKAGDTAKFWVEDLAPNSFRRIKREELEAPDVAAAGKPELKTDADGWPVAAAWPGMSKPLFAAGLGDFVAVTVVPPADRGTIERMHGTADAAAREKMRTEAFRTVPATYGATKVEETPHTLVCTQELRHPRLEKATRRLELWRREPRARLNVKFDRISSVAPEVFYINFSFPVEGVLPLFSNGGVPFTPFDDQLPGSCRDYQTIDGWARYRSADGDWLWVTRDAALVTVGGPHTLMRRTTAPEDKHRVMAMVFDNCWHTNFVANSAGTMEFQLEIAWRKKFDEPDATAEMLVSTPVAAINPPGPASPELMQSIFTA